MPSTPTCVKAELQPSSSALYNRDRSFISELWIVVMEFIYQEFLKASQEIY